MVYRWGVQEVATNKPFPILSLIDFTIRKIFTSKDYLVTLDSHERVHLIDFS